MAVLEILQVILRIIKVRLNQIGQKVRKSMIYAELMFLSTQLEQLKSECFKYNQTIFD